MIGTLVDSYLIQDLLGKGGMGVVYKALDTSLEKVVALKVMDPRLIDNDQFLRRFKVEARALGRLQHPHIVNVLAFRHVEPYLLMVTEYVEGGTLKELIERGGRSPGKQRRRSWGRWSPLSPMPIARGSSIVTSSRPISC